VFWGGNHLVKWRESAAFATCICQCDCERRENVLEGAIQRALGIFLHWSSCPQASATEIGGRGAAGAMTYGRRSKFDQLYLSRFEHATTTSSSDIWPYITRARAGWREGQRARPLKGRHGGSFARDRKFEIYLAPLRANTALLSIYHVCPSFFYESCVCVILGQTVQFKGVSAGIKKIARLLDT
jgi:hypothetical protein